VNNEITLQSTDDGKIDRKDILSLERKCNSNIHTLHLDKPTLKSSDQQTFMFVRKTSANDILKTNCNGIKYSTINFRPSQAQLDSILNSHKHNWTILVYHHLFDQLTEIPSYIDEKKLNEYFIETSDFEKQIRLMRNKNYWIAPEAKVYKYLKEKEESTIKYTQYQNMIFLRIINQIDMDVYDHPLTINFENSARTIRIKGSESDGTYTNRTGLISFNALPNKEITIEILDN